MLASQAILVSPPISHVLVNAAVGAEQLLPSKYHLGVERDRQPPSPGSELRSDSASPVPGEEALIVHITCPFAGTRRLLRPRFGSRANAVAARAACRAG